MRKNIFHNLESAKWQVFWGEFNFENVEFFWKVFFLQKVGKVFEKVEKVFLAKLTLKQIEPASAGEPLQTRWPFSLILVTIKYKIQNIEKKFPDKKVQSMHYWLRWSMGFEKY